MKLKIVSDILNTKGSHDSSYLVGLTPGLARDGKVGERKAFSHTALD